MTTENLTGLTIAEWKAALEGSRAAIDDDGLIWAHGAIFMLDGYYPEFGHEDPNRDGWMVCGLPTPEKVISYAEEQHRLSERMHERGRELVQQHYCR